MTALSLPLASLTAPRTAQSAESQHPAARHAGKEPTGTKPHYLAASSTWKRHQRERESFHMSSIGNSMKKVSK